MSTYVSDVDDRTGARYHVPGVMPVKITASKLRENIYRILDGVLETGNPVVIERHGRTLRIVADEPRSKLDNLVPNPDFIVGDPEDLVHMDWSHEWHPYLP